MKLGGPPGCMQYFTGNKGVLASYNYPTTSTAISATATHLSNQDYTICIRQEAGKCAICYTATIGASGADANDQVRRIYMI